MDREIHKSVEHYGLETHEKHTIVEHDSLEMNENSTNIHGNMLDWLEIVLNILQFSLQIVTIGLQIHINVRNIHQLLAQVPQ